MERKKKFRRAMKPSAQQKRNAAVEIAQEFPEGAFGAPPIERERKELRPQAKNENQQE